MKVYILFVSILFLTACDKNDLVTCLDDIDEVKNTQSLNLRELNGSQQLIIAVNKDRKYGKCFIDNLDIPNDSTLYEKAQIVLDFTANEIEYAPDKLESEFDDIDAPGTRYPSRTVADGEGDCEDKAALAALMLKELGLKTYVIRRPPEFDGLGHIFLGIKSEDETMIRCAGENIVTFDPTLENAKIGAHEYGLSKNKNVTCSLII